MTATGKGQRALTHARPTASQVGLSSSGRFVFTHWGGEEGVDSNPEVNANPEVWTASADGLVLKRIAAGENPVWSPDEQRIAFSRRDTRTGRFAVYVVKADGTGLRRLTSPMAAYISAGRVAWSPDGRTLAFSALTSIRTVDLASGSVATIHTFEDRGDPPELAWSPDGKWIAFVEDGFTELSLIRPSGADYRALTAGPHIGINGLQWRSDGTLTFVSDSDSDEWFAYAVNTNGISLRPLFRIPSIDWPLRLSWSPDGTTAVESSEVGHTVFLLNADGSGARQVLTGDSHTAPGWSPDGKRLAFATSDGLAVLDPSRRTTLFKNAPCSDSINWSPDATRLVCTELFLFGQGRSIGLVTFGNAGQSARRKILLIDQGIGDPTKIDADWSPDGKRLVYVEEDAGSTLAVFDFAHPAQDRGRPARQHIPTRGHTSDIYSPAWSPNGRQIAFADCASPIHCSGGGIYVVNVDGTGLKRIAPDGFNPEWSPDSKRIAFDRVRNGNRDIYVMDATGAHPVRLTSNPEAESDPSWKR